MELELDVGTDQIGGVEIEFRGVLPWADRDFERDRRFMKRAKDGLEKERGRPQYRTHWHNLTGCFVDDEGREYPKFWKSQKPPRHYRDIKSYQDLRIAIKLIAEGKRNCDTYVGVSGLNRGRLRLAQSLRDREVSFNVSDIMGYDYRSIKRLLKK